MTADPEQARVSHRDRLRAVKALRESAREGRLSDLTFMSRLRVVVDARRRRDLQSAVSDLPPAGLWARAEAAFQAWWERTFARPGGIPLDLRLPPAPGRYVIGRDYGCDLRLTDDSVSRRHAMLTSVDGQWMVVDLGSTNGTRINGWRLQVQTPLRPGDVLDLGLQRLRVVG
ncbi:FHA domain-containing protein [Phytohabitans kaempferiae]|uniref:FHA domain-containing protein n=1 Tax=Phytohabitans kaempferiae TaxID=1620943 RepID=A0ABV6MCU6_9ACTN